MKGEGKRLFSEIARLCERLEGTKKRTTIAETLGNYLKGLPPDEMPSAVNLVIGRIFPEYDERTLDVSAVTVLEAVRGVVDISDSGIDSAFSSAPDFGEAVRVILEKAGGKLTGKGLTIKEVYRAFEEMAGFMGPGSRDKKKERLKGLLAAATPIEAKYIAKDIIGEMRHGVEEGMVIEAISRTLSIPAALLRRAVMLTGDIGEVAGIAVSEGPAGLDKIGVRLFRPVKPMLARMASGVREVFGEMEEGFALEYKLDGARVQIHRKGGLCRVYSRRLTDITGSLPDVVEYALKNLKYNEVIVEGEAIAVTEEGRPLPFQVLSRRLGRVRDVGGHVKEMPVKLYLFDILYRDGELLIDLPYRERWKALERSGCTLVERVVPEGIGKGEAFFRKALEEGYEGLVAKALDSPYAPGVRGKAWLKAKKALSVDLVITAADWGYGRRRGWLSNYHLACLDEKTGRLLSVGKTFKGLTDKEFVEMTRRLLSLKTKEGYGTVYVRPSVVVEVLFSDIQKSPRYESGLALRFARISRVRDDKNPSGIDTLEMLKKVHEATAARALSTEG